MVQKNQQKDILLACWFGLIGYGVDFS